MTELNSPTKQGSYTTFSLAHFVLQFLLWTLIIGIEYVIWIST